MVYGDGWSGEERFQDEAQGPADWSFLPGAAEGFAAGPFDGPFYITLRRALRGMALPPSSALSEEDRLRLLAAIEVRLAEEGLQLDFYEPLSARLVYEGVLHHLDTPYPRPRPGARVSVDGCDAHCGSCFQKEACPVARKSRSALSVSESAVEPAPEPSAGSPAPLSSRPINPSLAAFLSSRALNRPGS